jgi:hypothetical protein
LCPGAERLRRQAKQLAANLRRVLQGEPTQPFAYRPLGVLASIGHRHAVADILGMRLSGFLAWVLWRSTYLAKMPTLAQKLELAIDWAWELLFPPNIVQLQLSQTEKVGRAHYGAGEYVFHKDDLGTRFFVIESGTAVAAFMRRAVDAASEQQPVVDAMVQLFRQDVEVLPVVPAEDGARVVGAHHYTHLQ